MYLRELRINGFKSFADKTRLTLEPGVTAIVGPNGCGKSNIADAIRWVLGEQSAKSLRAPNMQDVIFQGTDSRKPVNLCEVFLTFTDCERELGTAFNEVEIGRRVVRDGSSDYYLNGKACRLKDIQRLFMDTGVGRVSYSFLVQGQIDQILSTNPAERRVVFEEAAGISRYKAQRKEALTKLETVDTNLARVTDVLNEKTRQMASLKRQAAKALRWRRLRTRLSRLDLAHARHRWDGLAGAVKGLETELADFTRRLAVEAEQLAALETDLGSRKERRAALFASLQQRQQEVYDLRSEKEQAEGQAEFARLRATECDERRERYERELEGLLRRAEELAQRAAAEGQSATVAKAQVGTSDVAFQARMKELDALQQRLVTAEQELSRRRQALLMTESAITRTRQAATHLEIELKTDEARAGSLRDEAGRHQEDLVRLRESVAGFSREVEARRAARVEADAEVQRRKAALQERQQAYREAQGEIATADRALAQLSAQVKLLEGLQQKLEGFSEAARSLVQGKLGDVTPPGSVELLLPRIRVEDETATRAIEALLGPATDAVLVSREDLLAPLLGALSSKPLGRLSLAVPLGARAEESAGSPVAPIGLVAAASLLLAGDDESMASRLRRLFADTWVAEDLAAALAAAADPAFRFRLIATRAGELLDPRGLLSVGIVGKGGNDSFLRRQQEIRRLTTQRTAAEAKLLEVRERAARIHEQLDDGERGIEEARRQASDLASELSGLAGQERAAQESLRQAERRAAQAAAEVEAFDRRHAESVARLGRAREELAVAERELETRRAAIVDGETAVTRAREERDQRRESLAEVRLELAEQKQRLELLARGLSELERQRRDVEAQAAQRRTEIGTLKEDATRLAEDAGNQRARAGQLERKLGAVMAALEEDRQAHAAEEQAIVALEKDAAVHREAAGKLGEETRQRELRLTRDRAELEHLLAEVKREYEAELAIVDWKNLLWEAGPPGSGRVRVDLDDESPEETPEESRPAPTEADLAALDATDWAAVADEVGQLRARLAAMGPVNLVAIEEYKELKESHAFTLAQSNDLVAARTELLAAIDEINRTSVELFRQTFEQIRRNFQYTFEQLFGGGSSDLILTEGEDVLESGIDIIARPPGTKLRSLGLLSGGQKTMTAVALLFAIYMVKPSPFCVLDELDAPLDDANVGRFTAMLRKFLEYSQFLIITHNKRTIAAANAIYGVTMPERGVSRLLSLKFNPHTGEAEALPAPQAIGT